MKTTNKISYALVVISLLLGSVIAPIPLAIADEDGDKREKIKELKDEIEKISDNNKCKHHKYNGICDHKKPKIDITAPVKKSNLPTGLITIQGTASDEDTGIKNVKVRINHGPYQQATLFADGTWKLDTNLGPGKYMVTAKATDLAKNTKADDVQFKIISI